MGVSYFKGKFASCHSAPRQAEIDLSVVFTKDDCVAQGGEWVNADANFDNTLSAWSTLFQMMTTEGWVDVMQSGLDSVGKNM